MTPRFHQSLALLLMALLAAPAAPGSPTRGAEVPADRLLALAARFQSQMVLQRRAPLRIEGLAPANASVTVTFDGEISVTPADEAGRWSATLAPREASVLPRQLVVETGGQRVLVEDILIGDLWLMAGAAELAAPLGRAGTEHSRASLPGHVRFRICTTAAPLGDVVWTPEQRRAVADRYLDSAWYRGDVVDASRVSAIAWHFARVLESEQRVPLGIVQLAPEALPLESWMPRAALLSEPRLAPRLVGWWRSESVDAGLRARARRHFAGHFDRADDAPDAGVHPFQPGFLWDAGLGPLHGVPCAGVVFGCTTEEPAPHELHEHLLRTLIGAWREHFAGRLPFLLLESSGHDLFRDPDGLEAAFRRDAERRVAALDEGLPDVGQVVTTDLGRLERVPGHRAQVVGERLAALGLELAQGRAGVVSSGPTPSALIRDSKQPTVRLRFRQGVGLRTLDDGPLRGLSAHMADGSLVALRAQIVADELVLEFPAGASPAELRYGFGVAWQGNLVNRAGLPAPTFRLELAPARVIEAGASRGN